MRKVEAPFGDRQIKEIEKIIGYKFKDKELLKQCFTLSSASNVNNERLEFLGDAVIELYVSETLYRQGGKDEGGMTEQRKKFVSNDALYQTVKSLRLDEYIVYAGKEENLGKKPIASLFEAVAAGIYLDGGMPKAKEFIMDKLMYAETINYIGRLQEYLQKRGGELAKYAQLSRTGRDNAPTFTFEASARGYVATGTGASKQQAKQAAAKELLEKLKIKNGERA